MAVPQALSFTPAATPLSFRQNQAWNQGYSYCQNADPTQPINVTGYTPILQFRTAALASTTVLSLSVGQGITFNPTTCPQVQISTVINVVPGDYVYDCVLQGSSGNIVLGWGTVHIDAEVSR